MEGDGQRGRTGDRGRERERDGEGERAWGVHPNKTQDQTLPSSHTAPHSPTQPHTALTQASHRPHTGLTQASHSPTPASHRPHTGLTQASHRPHTASHRPHTGLTQPHQNIPNRKADRKADSTPPGTQRLSGRHRMRREANLKHG